MMSSTSVRPAIKPKPKPRQAVVEKDVGGKRSDETGGSRPHEPAIPSHESQMATNVVTNHALTTTTSRLMTTKDVNVDSSGRIMRPDVRVDEDQVLKLGEIIELLVAAGYFRARIKGLSDFDKVIGGICWAIDMCDVDVDIDLMFHESLTIGQKM